MSMKTQVFYTALTLVLYNAFDALVAHAAPTVHLSFNVAILTLGLIGALAARELDLRGRLAFVQRRIIREQVAELDAERTRSEDSIQVSEARRYDDIPPRAPPAARLRASRFSAARANVSERD